MFFEYLKASRSAFGNTICIVDIGGTPTGWTSADLDEWDRQLDVRISISLVNIQNFADAGHGRFSFVEADCGVPVTGVEGDIVFSNSVIEHLGNWPAMCGFAENCRNLGRFYFVQTPSFWSPMESHFLKLFIHYLPREMKVKRLVRSKNYSIENAFARTDEIFLMDKYYLRKLFPEATLRRERLLFLTKSYIMTNFPEAA
jgi:hypothetical protein